MTNLNHYKKRSAGFTLIELLVVISIIGLLSVIVLSSLTDARTRAKNTKLNEIALQYINAFNLMTDGGTKEFPVTTGVVCLGYEDDEYCIQGYAHGSSTLKTTLINYYPAMPKNDDYEVSSASGILYTNTASNPKKLEWFVSKDFQCPRGAAGTPMYDNDDNFVATKCAYSFDN